MGTFVCDNCHSVENTSYGTWHNRNSMEKNYGIPDGTCLCSECKPNTFLNGETSRTGGKWHRRFKRQIATREMIEKMNWHITAGSMDVMAGRLP